MADDPLLKKYPTPPTLAQFRKDAPQYADIPDGELADKLYERYKDQFKSDSPIAHPRVAFYAKINYNPYALKNLPHDAAELVSGATMGLVGPEAKTAEDRANQGAGREMLAALPASVMGGIRQAAPFVLNPPASWAAKIANAPVLGPAITGALGNPNVQRALATLGKGALYGVGLGGAGAGAGAGTYALLRRLGVIQ